jgi:hypothetical protein
MNTSKKEKITKNLYFKAAKEGKWVAYYIDMM